jgi:localization factor PodJL
MAVKSAIITVVAAALLLAVTGWSTQVHDHRQLLEDAEGGDSEAQYTLAHLYLKGRGGLALDVGRAIVWLERAAQQGHRDAAFDLALLYLEGTRVEKDNAQALAWLRQAAGADQPYAQFYLGLAYLPSEPETARTWLEKAAQNGSEEASSKLEDLCAGDQTWCD